MPTLDLRANWKCDSKDDGVASQNNYDSGLLLKPTLDLCANWKCDSKDDTVATISREKKNVTLFLFLFFRINNKAEEEEILRPNLKYIYWKT